MAGKVLPWNRPSIHQRNCIAAGNPATIIKRRFPETIADRLLALAWWEWDHESLRSACPTSESWLSRIFLQNTRLQNT
jgi:hypothetical protein